MAPVDAGRDRRRDDPFARFFEDFEKEFEGMRAMMNEVMEQAMKANQDPSKPFVYGFQFRMGPDGKPHISHFGDQKTLVPGSEPAREPLCDVVEGEKEVAVTVELPGVEKNDIKLHVAEQRVTLEVDAPRRYRKVLDLPARVKPSSAKATYKNGILDVTLEREAPRKDTGHRVDIE